jgi:biotin synthase
VGENWFPHVDDLCVSGSPQDELHARAAEAAYRQFGRRVFVRAVVEVSNYCRENCRYCGMRRDNRQLDRYRAEVDSLGEMLLSHRPASITDINFQAGEDPIAAREIVLPLVKLIRRETALGVSVCLGTLAPALTRELQAAGAATYIIKFELADPVLYDRLEAPGTLAERVARIRQLAVEGWNVSSGFIAGLPGQNADSMLQNFRLAADLPLAGCSVSPFVPGEETPLSAEAPAGINLSLNCMAALRLMRPGWVIPAVSALNLADREAGYRRGLRAGANLCTINMTPERHRGDYLLYKRDRFVMTEERVLEAISAEGLEPSAMGLGEFYAGRECAGSPEPAPFGTERALSLS